MSPGGQSLSRRKLNVRKKLKTSLARRYGKVSLSLVHHLLLSGAEVSSW
jgi:hypothetical protein